MKSLVALLCVSVAFATFGCANFPPGKDKPAKPVDLQVLVNVPPTWRPFLDDDVAEEFFYRLQDTFRLRGYTGELAQVTVLDPGAKDRPTLTINLSEWRLDRIGNAQCTFSASLTTPAGEKNLGLKMGTTMLWAHGGRWGLSRSYDAANALESAAADALNDLYRAVADSGLVTKGFPAKK